MSVGKSEITWQNCFSPKRYKVSSPPDIRSEYERDWDRIIFSSPFRRLQNKTQVFPLPEEIFVHNRLTHSLEVASVGRSLGKLVGEELAKLMDSAGDEIAKDFYENNLKHVISAACLAHDLGNPAFGHSGEEAISKYFKKRDTSKAEDVAFKAQFTAAEWSDLVTFEGNANALRILTMKQSGRAEGGFRLTFSTLASIIKYPCDSLASDKKVLHRKKYGFFKIDEPVFQEIKDELHMVADNVEGRIVYKRHPFVFLVEAADDICYNIIDFEDAHRMGILSYDEVKTSLMSIIQAFEPQNMVRVKQQAEDLLDDPNQSISYLRAKSINALTHLCADVFNHNREAILQGDFKTALIDSIPELKDVVDSIAALSVKKIYNAKRVVELEIAGFRIMSGLVEDFVSATLTPKADRDKEQKKILELLPSQFAFEETDSAYVKVMHILDFISGMTDVYALKLYRKLRGIEI